MPQIPSVINQVTIEFKDTVVNDVDQRLIDALFHCISPSVAPGYELRRLLVSSAFDSHTLPSRHMMKKGIDISRVNGMTMFAYYNSDAAVRAITQALQERFETFLHRRENFGPHFKKKLGQPWNVTGHNDHIHLSVN